MKATYFHWKKTWYWLLEANKKHVSLKSYSLKIRIDSVIQILWNNKKVKWPCNINILTGITDQKILCVYSCLSNDIKTWGPGLYNPLCHTHDKKYFSDFSLTRNQREVCTIHLAKEVGEIWRCSCWEKGNFILIYEFKYDQTWKFWPSPLSLSIYNTFKESSTVVYRCPKSLFSYLVKNRYIPKENSTPKEQCKSKTSDLSIKILHTGNKSLMERGFSKIAQAIYCPSKGFWVGHIIFVIL